MDDSDDRYRAPALDKGLDILELLAATDGGLTQAEIGKQLGRRPSEFYRMLDRLVARGYVARTDGVHFALTLKLFGLSQLHLPTRRLASYATPIMRDLASDARQANHLVVFDRGRAVVIAQQEAPEYWGVSIRVGAHMGLLDTGSGHVLLAFTTPDQRDLMLMQFHDSGQHSDLERGLSDTLRAVRRRGYQDMPSAQTEGVYNLSAPVLGPDGTAIAALTIPYLGLVEAGAPDRAGCLDMLVKATQTLSRSAGKIP